MHEEIAKYLANEMDNNERLEFESRLLVDDALQDELFSQLTLLESAMPSAKGFNAATAYQKVRPRLSKVIEMPRRRSFSLLKIAATLLVLLTAGFLLTKTLEKRTDDSAIIYRTDANIDVIELLDGTMVRLNANSRLELAEGFGENNREVILTGGANFDVSSNAELPFVISASNGSIEVVGTVFDVNAYPFKDLELNVTEGKVKLASKTVKKEELFKAGETGLLTADGTELTKSTQKNANYSAWWTRRLVFEDAPLNEVFTDLEKAYNVEIDYDEALSSCTYGAILEDYTLTETLEVIKTIFPNISKIEIKDSLVKLEGTACNN